MDNVERLMERETEIERRDIEIQREAGEKVKERFY